MSSSRSSRISSAAVIWVRPQYPPGPRWVCVIRPEVQEALQELRPVSAHSADAALLSDRVIIASASAALGPGQGPVLPPEPCGAARRGWSPSPRWPSRSARCCRAAQQPRARVVDLDRHDGNAVRRAVWMARPSLAASAGWEEDAQTAREAAAELAALAGPAASATPARSGWPRSARS